MAQPQSVLGIFGLSPEMYAQRRQDELEAEQMAVGKMSSGPGSLLNPSMANIYGLATQQGQMIGQGVKGLLGVEDPQMQMVRDVQQMRTQFDVSTPQGLRSFAQALGQKGYTDLAMQATARAADIDKDLATVTAKNREQFSSFGKLIRERDAIAAANPNDPRIKDYNKAIAAEQEGKGTKIVMPAGETEASKIIGKGVGEKILATASAGESGADNLIKINETLTELKTNKAFTGSFSDLQTNIAKVQAKFAADKEAGKRVTDTEYLDALLGSDVFPMISSLGIGAKGLDTPAEREFLRKVMTGTVALERDTLIKLTETRKNIAERAVKKYNEKVESGELNEYFKIKGIAPRKIDIPKSDDSAALGADYEAYAQYWVSKGKTPKTREQYIQEKRNLQGGKP